MNAGSGKREFAYFRIIKEGKPAFDISGKMSSLPKPTHFNINPATLLEDIKKILNKIKS